LTTADARNPFTALVLGEIVVWLLRRFSQQGALVAKPMPGTRLKRWDA
jgi:hypothetical protein